MRLSIPQQQKRLPENISADPKEYAEWLQQLPMADITAASKQLLEALKELNRSTFDGADRLLIMESSLKTVETLCRGLSQGMLREAFPLRQKPADQIEILHGLLAEVANGYKIIISSLASHSSQVGEGVTGGALHLPVYRALYFLVLLLREHYAVYLEEKEGLWGELHALYRFSVQRRFHERELDDEHMSGVLSISHIYKIALLLALASPYHLMRGEVHKIYHLLLEQADYLKLSFSAASQSLIGKFVVDTSAGSSPQYISPERVPEGDEKYLVLDLSRLLHSVDQFIGEMLMGRSKATSKGKTTLAERMERDMYLRLVRAWGERQNRGAERSSQSGDIELLIGMMECHYTLSGQQPFLPEEQELALMKQQDPSQVLRSRQFALSPKLNQGEAAGFATRTSQFTGAADDDGWEKHYELQAHQAKLYESAHSVDRQQKTYVLQQSNVSAGGMMLQCDDSISNQLSVGELLAFHSAESDEWTICAVRWLMSRDGKNFALGVKFLSKNAKAIAAKAVEGVGKGGEYFRALLLDEGGSKAQLLVPAAIFDIGTVLRVVSDDQMIYARLTGLQDSSDIFSLFKFTHIHTYNEA